MRRADCFASESVISLPGELASAFVVPEERRLRSSRRPGRRWPSIKQALCWWFTERSLAVLTAGAGVRHSFGQGASSGGQACEASELWSAECAPPIEDREVM